MNKIVKIISVFIAIIVVIIGGIILTKKLYKKENIDTAYKFEKNELKNMSNEISNESKVIQSENNTKVEKNNTTNTDIEKITPTPTPTPEFNNNKEQNSKVTTQNQEKTIVIDPGHQRRGDNSKEPIGPGATETKAKVTTGATGVTTKQLESELNLKVSKLLKIELEKRGYKVLMTRTSQDVNLSNSQRADIANKANADVFVRIHADSAESEKAVGMSTLCQTSKNKYNGNLAEKSYNLSKSILDNMAKTTGAKSRGVTRTDNMSGINWAKVPTTIIEMGFLSNPEEDKKLASDDYQVKIVNGIANGIDNFIK